MPLKLSQEELPSINLTSMIDVLFLLLIFFMVGTRFSENEGSIEIHLPKVANGGAMMTAPQGKVVALQTDGRIRFDGNVISIQQLEAALQEATRNYPDLKVEFEADGTCSHQMVCEVLATIQKAGNKNLNLRYASTQMPRASVQR